MLQVFRKEALSESSHDSPASLCDSTSYQGSSKLKPHVRIVHIFHYQKKKTRTFEQYNNIQPVSDNWRSIERSEFHPII